MKLKNYLGYRDLVKMDEPVCTNLMCYKLGCLYQGWKKYSGTDIIESTIHKYKPKDIENYVTSDYQKTHRNRHTSG